MSNMNKEKRKIHISSEDISYIEKQLGHIRVSENTSPLEVSFQLGIQAVIKFLREERFGG